MSTLTFLTFAQMHDLYRAAQARDRMIIPISRVLNQEGQPVALLQLWQQPDRDGNISAMSDKLRLRIETAARYGNKEVELNVLRSREPVELYWRRDILIALHRLYVSVPIRFAVLVDLHDALQAALTAAEEAQRVRPQDLPLRQHVANLDAAVRQTGQALDQECLATSM